MLILAGGRPDWDRGRPRPHCNAAHAHPGGRLRRGV